MGLRGQRNPVVSITIKQTGDKEVKKIVKGMNKIGRSTKGILSNLSQMRNVFFAVFGGIGIRSLTGFADTVQLLRDRIFVFSGDIDETKKSMENLFAAADLTATSIDSVGETFNRVALATKELGLTTDQLIGFTATLQNTFRLSGATIAESTAASVQLSQALASGQLRGQELRSVLEANVVIGGILADTLGTTRGQLIKFAESGKITSDVVLRALSDNAQDLANQASKLGRTFEQTFILITNAAKKTVDDFNTKFKLNELFEDFARVAIESINNVINFFSPLITIVGTFANSFLPLIITASKLANPFVSLIDKFGNFFENFFDLFQKFDRGFRKFLFGIVLELNKFTISLDKFRGQNKFFDIFLPSELSVKRAKKGIKEISKAIADLNKEIDKPKGKQGKTIESLLEAFKNLGDINLPKTVIKASDAIKLLNAQLAKGEISLSQYNKQLMMIEEADLAKRFEEGQISALQFRNELVKIKDINDTFVEKVFTGFVIAASNYSRNIGSLTSQLQRAFEQTFTRLEDLIFDFVRNGKASFKDFANAVIEDLTRIAIRQAFLKPIIGAIGDQFFTPGVSVDRTLDASAFQAGPGIKTSAKGNVFSQGRQIAFARGGIIDSPMLFPLRNGTGLAGEAGPEAIVPLSRTSSGDLGVKANPSNVVVNVNNNAGVDVDIQSTQLNGDNVLDVTITRAVNNAISKGQFDRAMQSNFGVNRKGLR